MKAIYVDLIKNDYEMAYFKARGCPLKRSYCTVFLTIGKPSAWKRLNCEYYDKNLRDGFRTCMDFSIYNINCRYETSIGFIKNLE